MHNCEKPFAGLPERGRASGLFSDPNPTTFMLFHLPQRSESSSLALRSLLAAAALLAAITATTQAQVTITSADLFNQVGQYYQAYANNPTNTVTITSTMLGSASTNAQFWDFSTGPTDVTYRFDYLPASQGTNGADFVALGATMAQRQTMTNDPADIQFLYFKLDPTRGQVDYGFYDPSFSASQPESFFTNVNGLQDFPNTIQFGGTWSGATVFESVYSLAGFGDFPDQITYTSTDTVDAFGYVNLPDLGLQECLRVHEAVEYDTAMDLGSGYQSVGTEYILNYYWLVPGHGIAVQINSTPSSTPVADALPGGAQELVRMFQAYHPTSVIVPTNTYIQGLKLAFLPTAGFLSWTALTGASSYTVQYSTNLVSSTNWHTLTTTASNFALDPAAVTASAPRRFYRVLTTLGPK